MIFRISAASVVLFTCCTADAGPPESEVKVVVEKPVVEKKAVVFKLDKPAPGTTVRAWTGRRGEYGRVYDTVMETEGKPSAVEARVTVVIQDPPVEIRRAAAVLPHYNSVRAKKITDILRGSPGADADLTTGSVAGMDLSMYDIKERPESEGGGTTFKVHAMASVRPARPGGAWGVTQSSDHEENAETWLIKDGEVRLLKDRLMFEFIMFP